LSSAVKRLRCTDLGGRSGIDPAAARTRYWAGPEFPVPGLLRHTGRDRHG